MSLSPWDKFYYWLTGSFPKKTAQRIHEEFEKLQEETAAAFKARKESKAELKPKAKAPAKPKATTAVKKTSAPKAKPATKATPKPAGKTSTNSSSKKKSSK